MDAEDEAEVLMASTLSAIGSDTTAEARDMIALSIEVPAFVGINHTVGKVG